MDIVTSDAAAVTCRLLVQRNMLTWLPSMTLHNSPHGADHPPAALQEPFVGPWLAHADLQCSWQIPRPVSAAEALPSTTAAVPSGAGMAAARHSCMLCGPPEVVRHALLDMAWCRLSIPCLEAGLCADMAQLHMLLSIPLLSRLLSHGCRMLWAVLKQHQQVARLLNRVCS